MKLDRPTIGELIDYLSTIRKKMTYVITEDKKKGVIRVTATLGNYHVHAIGRGYGQPIRITPTRGREID